MVDDQKIKAILEWEKTKNDQGTKVVPWVGQLLLQVRAGLRQNRQAIIRPLEEIGIGNLG